MKRISFLVITITLFFIILHILTSIYTLWHKQDLLTNAQLQLLQEREEKRGLQKELSKVKSPQFVDQEARDKLLLVKPGESEVLIDKNLLEASASAKSKKSEPYWQQWLDLFFR